MTAIYFVDLELSLQKNELNALLSKTAKAMTQKLAVSRFGIKEELSEIAKTDNQKPYFKNYPELHFNISHSGSAIAVAFSDSPIGVDIEKIRKVDMRVAERLFSKEELKTVKSLDGNEANVAFLKLWTAKEAAVKMKGLTLKDITHPIPSHISTEIIGDYILSVCEENPFKKEIIILEKTEVL